MTPTLEGIHHVTAVTAEAQQNLAFYRDTLGMRLVKKTVNQDDVRAYHLFYADGRGSPGTDLTFFDWAMAAPEHRGSHSVARTGLRVAGGTEALAWWRTRLTEAGARVFAPGEVDGRLTLPFEDPEGQRLALVDDAGAGPAHPWQASGVPVDRQIRGLGPVTLSVPDPRPTMAVLVDVMGMRPVRRYELATGHQVQVVGIADGGPGAEVHVAAQPDLPPARPGAGGVHHVAFRTPDDAQHGAWLERLNAHRIPNSGRVDRFYFRSLYFREPNGILFEIATDGPGFDVDEPLASLGEGLALPPFLEPRREDIEGHLRPLA
ncbi:MAG TPA: ring-cleaving dioxygenase [Trueperaceae bacterium]|nr:ring-cleaving dioxygenase [Trueperaceae bacterium]